MVLNKEKWDEMKDFLTKIVENHPATEDDISHFVDYMENGNL